MGKVVAGIVVVIILAVAGAGVYLMQNIDGIVKDLVEQVGTETTGTEVRVADVSINLGEGSATLSGLTVANPPGFSAEPLFSLGSIKVAIDTASLTGDVYVINSIDVSDVKLLAEQKGASTNVQALMDGMEDSGSTTEAESGTAADDVLMAIRQINFDDGAMELRSQEFGTQQVALKALRLRDVGTPERGLTPEEVSVEIADQLMDQVKDAAADAFKAYAREQAESKLKEKLGDLFK